MKKKEVKKGLVVFARINISEFNAGKAPSFGYKIVSEEANWRAPGKWDRGGNVQANDSRGILVRMVRRKEEEWQFENSREFVASLASMVLLEEYQTKCAALKVEEDRKRELSDAKHDRNRALEKRAEDLGYEVRVHDGKVKMDDDDFERLLTELETLRAK